MLAGIFLLENRRPTLLAIGVDAQHGVFTVLGGRQVDLAIQVDRSRASFARHGGRPSQFVFGESRREIPRLDRA